MPALPDDLTDPIGRSGDAPQLLLHPRAVAFMTAISPPTPTDTYAFDLPQHRLTWRVRPWTTDTEREASLDLLLGDTLIGTVTADRLPEPRFHQSPSLPRIKLWDAEVSRELATTQRRARGPVAALRGTTKTPVYALAWAEHRWIMATDPFPRAFGLWAPTADEDIAGPPLVRFIRRRGSRPARLEWTAEATLLDLIVGATRGLHGSVTHLATGRAQVAYAIASELSI